MSREMAAEIKHERMKRISHCGFDYTSQPKTSVQSCNLCGADQWTILTHRDRYGYPAQATACRVCGLTMLNPRMTAEAYAGFYQNVYRPLVSAYHGRLINAKTIQGEQRTYAAQIEQFLAPVLVRGKHQTLLDVGGSTGVVAAHLMHAFKMQATVIDPAPDEACVAASSGLETVEGFVEHWQPDRNFDIVAMFQTIDHLMDARSTLVKLRSIVSADGFLVFDIVDFRAAYLRHWSIEEAVKIDHVYSFTEMTTDALLARTGFETVRKSYSDDKLHVLYLCRPAVPHPNHLPAADQVSHFFDEVRFVQNAPFHSVTAWAASKAA